MLQLLLDLSSNVMPQAKLRHYLGNHENLAPGFEVAVWEKIWVGTHRYLQNLGREPRPKICHDMLESQKCSDLPPIGPNIMTNNGGSLPILVCHICTTIGQESGIGGYTITHWKGILQGKFSRACCWSLNGWNKANHGRCLLVHATHWKVRVDINFSRTTARNKWEMSASGLSKKFEDKHVICRLFDE